jgi:hypothetical protein
MTDRAGNFSTPEGPSELCRAPVANSQVISSFRGVMRFPRVLMRPHENPLGNLISHEGYNVCFKFERDCNAGACRNDRKLVGPCRLAGKLAIVSLSAT